METLIDLLTPLTAWHWLVLALALLAIEVAAGTFDLLWVSIAAFATALFEAVAPGVLSDWKMQCLFFFVTSVVLIVMGRTVFSGLRHAGGGHPTLNRRMESMIGLRGSVIKAFESGLGRVKIGDTVWSAESVDGMDYVEGDAIAVEATAGNMVKVRLV